VIWVVALALGDRPRGLPIAPLAPPAKRRLPLAAEVRPEDAVRPLYAVWEITLACDLGCRHCGSRAGRARPDELSTAECLDLVHQMKDLGVFEVTLIGGEAYLRDDWAEVAREIRKCGMQCTMTTGGRGLTRERARLAKEAGVQSVSVSVDGLRESHDLLRGVEGSFDAAMAALGALRDAGVPVAANSQINRVNVDEIPALFDRLVEERIHGWQCQLTTAMGRAADEEDLLLEPWQVLDVIPMLAELKKKADAARVRFFPGNNIGYYGPYEAILRASFPGKHRGTCGAGRSTLGIEADGSIKGCPSLSTDEWVGGNVRDAKLVDIWERAAALRFTRDQQPSDLRGFCKTCYYAEDCKAGCNWTTHVLFGHIGDNPYCFHRASTLKEQGVRETLRKVEDAPGVPFDHGRFECVREPWPR
jgi:radical SAM protein with 4Fe4S-binding SPASM domain